MFLATGVVAGAVLFLWQSGWRRLVVLASMPLILNGLILTGSRGAFLGLVAAGFVLFVLRPPQRRWMFWGAASLGVVLAVRLMDEAFIERMLSIKAAAVRTEEMDSSAESRWVLIEAQAMMAVNYPHGTGHRGTAVLSPLYLEARWLTRERGQSEGEGARASHNTFMTLLVEQGVPGALLYLWISAWGAFVVWRLKSANRQKLPLDLIAPATACAAGIAVVWTAGHFADYLKAEVQIWLFAMLVVSLQKLRRAASCEPSAGAISAHVAAGPLHGLQPPVDVPRPTPTTSMARPRAGGVTRSPCARATRVNR
jgi:O-antigen ligase